MFEKDELAAPPQDSSYTAKGLRRARNRAEREGAHDRIDGAVLQWNAFARKVQELNVQLR